MPQPVGARREDVDVQRDVLLLAAFLLAAVDLVAPRLVGDDAVVLAGQVDPGGLAEADLARVALDDEVVALAVEGVHAQLVEVDVRRDLDRARQVDRAVARLLGVAALDLADLDAALVVDRRARRDEALLEAGERGDRLERRAGRVLAGDRAVEQRRAGRLAEQRVVALLRELLGQRRGIERRRRAHRHDRAVARIHRDERARLAAGDGRVRLLGGALQADVERQAQALAGDRLVALQARVGHRPPGRVDLDALRCRRRRAGSGRTCAPDRPCR